MRIEQLQYLTEISKTGSITIAANHLHVSQQNISQSIQKLEQELSVSLLHRSSQGVTLTKDGQLFVEKAQVVLKHFNELELQFKVRKPSNSSLSLKGDLVIYSSPTLISTYLPEAIGTFSKAYPNVNITLKEKETLSIIKAIEQNKCCLGLVNVTDLSKYDNIEVLFSDKVVLCISKQSSLLNQKSVHPSKIVKLPLIVIESDYTLITEALEKYDKPNIVLKTSSREVQRQAILNGIGVCLASDTALKKGIPFNKNEITTINLRNTRVYTGIVRSNQHPYSKAALEFIKVLKDIAI